MTTGAATIGQTGPARPGSIQRSRRWALIWSYVFLVLFAVFFLMPPIYMFITSLKSSGGTLEDVFLRVIAETHGPAEATA
jgi:multiple sugar transport system permease protein